MRRRLYTYQLGVKKEANWSVGGTKRILDKLGFKTKIDSCSLSGFMRWFRDHGWPDPETVDSLAGYNYSQVAKISLYAYPDDVELIEIIIRGCYCDILDPSKKVESLKPFL
jgi:hypothetical protein